MPEISAGRQLNIRGFMGNKYKTWPEKIYLCDNQKKGAKPVYNKLEESFRLSPIKNIQGLSTEWHNVEYIRSDLFAVLKRTLIVVLAVLFICALTGGYLWAST